MRIGILSDSHDHVWNLRAALGRLREEAGVLIHCGDLCSPFIVPILAREFPGPVHAVFGNNDADRWRLQTNAAKTDRVQLHGEFFFPEFGGLRFAVQHFDAPARALADSGRYDVVCYGHDHRAHLEQVGPVWLVNPGSILGYQPVGGADVDPTFAVFDTERRLAELWRIRAGSVERAEPA
jgi:putative phosphoesterase